MKRLYEWITKANQVLLFFLIIGVAILIFLYVYDRSRTYEPPHVSVAQSAEEAKGSVVQDVIFLGRSPGLYVFGIEKRVVTSDKEPWSRPKGGYLGAGDDPQSQTVNIVLSNGERRLRTLLQKDGLVLYHDMYDEKDREKRKVLLFRCVTDDTDGNHRLDENDRNDLYVVADGLERPDLVVQGISDFRAISPTHLAVKTGENSAPHFWDIDLETQTKKEIAWK